MPTTVRQLSTAEERREAVLAAAMHAFGAKGYYGTPTMEIAKAAGISQAYLFRLFPTKLELFLAVLERAHEAELRAFAEAAARAKQTGERVLSAMGVAYVDLVADRDLLLVLLQAQTATGEPAIRDAVRDGFRRVHELVVHESEAGEEEVRDFFATGMLINVLASIGAFDETAGWALALCPRKPG